MAGDLQPMEMPQDSTVEELVKRLSALDIAQYPPYRTHVFRPSKEESKEEADSPLEDEEMVAVFVSEGYEIEEGILDGAGLPLELSTTDYMGTPYARITVPWKGYTDYLYLLHPPVTRKKSYTGRMYLVTGHPNLYAPIIYRMDTELVNVFSRGFPLEELRKLEQIADSYYQKKEKEQDEKETVCARREFAEQHSEHELCGCGSMIKKTGLKAHYKTKKHQAYLASQK